MGVAQTCMKEKNSTPQIEYSVPMIFKRKPQGKKPRKQNILIPPLSQLGENEESLEQLELTLQETNINFSIHKTATFNNKSKPEFLSQYNNPKFRNVIDASQFIFQETNQNNQEPIQQKQQQHKESLFKMRSEARNDRRDNFARSLSNNSRAQRAQKDNDESSISQRKDSETNTKKYIEKQITNPSKLIKRGISLKQQQPPLNFDDTQSQKHPKVKKSKIRSKNFQTQEYSFLQ